MGCWNGTCMISNLPILSRDKIKLVILQKGYNSNFNSSSGYVYSSDLFSPAFLPISGSYNDYGMIENIIEDWNYSIIEEHLIKKFGKTIRADRKEKENWNLMDFLKGIERSSLSHSDPLQYLDEYDILKDCNLSFVMIREDIWNECVNNQLNNGEYWNFEEREEGKDIPYYINGHKYLNKLFDNFEEGLSNPDIFHPREYVFSGMGPDSTKPLLGNPNYIKYCKSITDLTDVRKQWIELTSINSIISNLHKGWVVQPGAGCQNTDWETHIFLSETIIKICEFNLEDECEEE
jgi:hypothetical protein